MGVPQQQKGEREERSEEPERKRERTLEKQAIEKERKASLVMMEPMR